MCVFSLSFGWRRLPSRPSLSQGMWQWVCAESSVYYFLLDGSRACLESTASARYFCLTLLLCLCYGNRCIRSFSCLLQVYKNSIKVWVVPVWWTLSSLLCRCQGQIGALATPKQDIELQFKTEQSLSLRRSRDVVYTPSFYTFSWTRAVPSRAAKSAS